MASNFLANNTGLIAFVFIGGFFLWKFVIQPIANEGQPIEDQDPESTLPHQD